MGNHSDKFIKKIQYFVFNIILNYKNILKIYLTIYFNEEGFPETTTKSITFQGPRLHQKTYRDECGTRVQFGALCVVYKYMLQ